MGFLLPALIVLILDQATKQFFWHLGRNFDVIDGFFRVTLVRNSGAAFGMLQDGRVFLVASSIIASLFILFLAQRLPAQNLARRVFLGLILGGALGNLVDRIYPGQVIDFIDMGIPAYRWPVYNIADSAVTIGGLLLVLSVTRSRNGGEE
ncbi:MAG: signal peptidase II [Candidatus Krumholzibacteria bacterium]